MFRSSLRRRLVVGAITAVAALAGPGAAGAMADQSALFTQTNDPAGNVVQKFDRSRDGRLTAAGTFSTGGLGLAGLGGRQGAVALSDDGDTVYATNAGSNSVSAFRVRNDHRNDGRAGLELVGTFGSGGVAPLSVDEDDGRVYVLNSGGTPNVTAFSAGRRGALAPIPGGTRDLPGADGAAQVSVTPGGDGLVVSERLANRLETLALDQWGRPGEPVSTASSGSTPFGFGFGRHGELIVSEAGSSSVSSYRLGAFGPLSPVTASLPLGQGGVCWVAVSPTGRLAFTGNAGGTISGLAVGSDGALEALGATPLQPSPRDLAFSRDGRYLYAVSPGTAATGGRVTGYHVESDGRLTEITSVPAAAGLTGVATS
jgi:6-phosphogluconolactonase